MHQCIADLMRQHYFSVECHYFSVETSADSSFGKHRSSQAAFGASPCQWRIYEGFLERLVSQVEFLQTCIRAESWARWAWPQVCAEIKRATLPASFKPQWLHAAQTQPFCAASISCCEAAVFRRPPCSSSSLLGNSRHFVTWRDLPFTKSNPDLGLN